MLCYIRYYKQPTQPIGIFPCHKQSIKRRHVKYEKATRRLTIYEPKPNYLMTASVIPLRKQQEYQTQGNHLLSK